MAPAYNAYETRNHSHVVFTMNLDELRAAIMATPFQDFVLHLADDRGIPIVGRDFILLSPVGHSATIYQRDGTLDLINTSLITGLKYEAPVPLMSSTTP